MKLPKDQLAETNDFNPIFEEIEATFDSIREEIPEPQEIPEFPTDISINNFPETQKVEIVNFPEQEKDDREWMGRANQSVIHLLDLTGSALGNANANSKFYLVRDAALTGPVNFLTAGTNSCAYIDKAATGMTTPSDSQIVYTRSLTTAGDFAYAFSDREITLQPGESVTLAVKSLTATASCTGSLNTREDQ